MMESVMTRDITYVPEAESGMSFDKPILRADISRPYWTKIKPTSGASFFTLDGNSSIQWRLPSTAYMSPQVGAESYVEFSITIHQTPNVTVWVEPESVFQREDQLINQNNINATGTRRDKLAASKAMDCCAQSLYNAGVMAGIPIQYGPQGQPLLSTIDKTAHNCFDVSFGSVTKHFSVPLRWICDGLLTDRDSLVCLQYLNEYQLQLQLTNPSFCSYAQNLNAPVAAPPIIISNLQLVIPLVYVSSEQDSRIRATVDSRGLVYNTEVVVANQVGPFPIGSVGSNTLTFGSMPKSVKYIEVLVEGSSQATHPNCAWKEKTSLQAGISSYQFLLDYKPVVDLPIETLTTQAPTGTTLGRMEGYRAFLEEVNARKRNQRLYKELSGTVVDPRVFSGSRYLSCDPQAVGAVSVSLLSHFRMVCDLSSVSRELYDGTKFQYLQLAYNTSSDKSYWDGDADGVVNDLVETVNFILYAYCNRGCLITRGGYTELY
jgi:hypothetical protein